MKKIYRSASPSQTHSSGKIKIMFQTTNQIKKDALDGGQSNGRASGETCLILCGLAMHIDFTSVHFLKKKAPCHGESIADTNTKPGSGGWYTYPSAK
jgi:hypothetical protein